MIFALVFSRIMVGLDLNFFYPILWLGMYILWSFQILLSWGTASMVCDTRQAKRLFPLFSAGGILGIAVGGLVTKPLVKWIGTENLLLVWAGSFVIAFVLIRLLIKNTRETQGASYRRRTALMSGFRQGLLYVQNSSLMRRISITAILLGLLYFVIAYPFSKAVASQFANEEALAGFLGIFYGLSTAAALAASLLLANRLYARFGFITAIWILPVIYLLGFTTLTVRSAFPVLIVFRFFQVFWLQGISDTAYQAVFNIVPSERREQSRAFINGFPRQIGYILAGLILLISQQALPVRLMFMIGAAAASGAFVVVWLAKRTYGNALIDALRTGHPGIFFTEEEPFSGFQADAGAVDAVLAGVADPDPHMRRIAAEILGNLPLPGAAEALVKALKDPDPEVRAALLRSLEKADASQALLEISVYLNDPEPEVRLQSIKTLARMAAYPDGLIAHVQPLLDDTDSGVRATAASTILEFKSHDKALAVLKKMILSEKVEYQVLALEALENCKSDKTYETVSPYLNNRNSVVRRAALLAAARIDPHRSMESLVSALGDEDRSVVETAAAEIPKADPQAYGRLIEALQNPQLEAGALESLRYLQGKRTAGPILRYGRDKLTKMHRYEKLQQLAEQRTKGRKYSELLLESLQNCARAQAIHALKAIGLLKDPDTVALAIEGLNSDDTEQKANALEMLDSVGEREIVTQILEHWEHPVDVNKMETSAKDRSSWPVSILQDSDPWVRACAVLTVTTPRDQKINDILHNMLKDQDPIVRETTKKVLKEEKRMKTLPTLSVIERIFFLRQVPLFSSLPPGELKQIAAICVEEDFLDNEIIARKGEEGDRMYIIVTGEIRVITDDDRKKGSELANRRTGEYVGEMAIVSNEPRMASLVANGQVRTLCILQKQFEHILRHRPETSLAVMRVLCSRLRDAQG
jgi:HEAT repeat protein